MITLPGHADGLLSMMVLLLLPGFMSAIVHLAACLRVFSGGHRRAVVHVCLRFVVTINLIIRVSICLLICNICVVGVVATQISHASNIFRRSNFCVTTLLQLV